MQTSYWKGQPVKRARFRDRAELLIRVGNHFIVEQLGSPRYPQSIGHCRCPGGKIEQGEDPVTTLRREFMEEYGLELKEEIKLLFKIQGKRGIVARYVTEGQIAWAGKKDIEEGTSMLLLTDVVPNMWM